MKPARNKSTDTLDRIAKDYWMETFERFPVTGSWAGLSKLQGELGQATVATYTDQIALTRRTLDALLALPIHDFEGDPLLDRLTLRAHLITELMKLDDLKTWRTNPQGPLETCAGGIHGILIRHADRLKAAAPDIISRLGRIPRFLDEAVDCIRSPVPLWVRLTQESAPGVKSLLQSLPGELAKVSPERPRRIAGLVAEACEAVDRYAARIGRLKPGPVNGYSIGRERFERMIRERLGLNWSADEAKIAGLNLIEKLKIELAAEARRFSRSKSAGEILDEAASLWNHGATDLLAAYTGQMQAMRERFIEAEAMTFPKGDRLIVKPVPDFMANQFPTAAYSSPGPLEKDQTGIFWVNDLSLRQTSTEAKRREIAQHFGLELTSAHEGYPGHHLQFAIQNQHPSLTRRMADHAIYYEGWTLWCEQMCVDLKVTDNPYLRLQQLQDALWRANRIVIDCGLHTGELTFNAACKRLVEHVGFTRRRAEGDVNWYTSSPTVPMSYLLGKMELLRLKRQRVDQGGWTLKQFNDWVLGFGAIPWSWIEASGR